MKPPLTPDELDRIQAAVAEAEAHTSGEIVPFIVPRSGRYEVAIWRGAAGFALASMTLALLVLQVYDGWGLAWLYESWGFALLVLLAGTLGAVLTTLIPALRRVLAGRERIARRVHRRAMQAFVEEEVFTTRDRTGILIFISLFEHQIEVLGDEGINREVEPEDWADVIESIRKGIRKGHLADGIIDAFGQCGVLLKRCGVTIKDDDTNELSDEVRFRSEP